MEEFKLSASLQGHEDDVRSIAFAGTVALLSASRDSTVRLWTRQALNPPLYEDAIAFHGDAFRNCVTYMPSTHAFPDGLIVSSGKDTIIDVRQPGRPPESDAERLLIGHQGNVCALDICPDPRDSFLVSGSWDSSAMIWDIEKGQEIATLEDHQASVWDVLAYDRERIITACADQHVRIFSREGKLLKKISAGSQPVRALCRLPATSPAQFASAGNDGIIRLWLLDGTQVAELHGHDNFIYSLASLPNGDIISSGEDRTLRVWRNHECIQTITHPAISVWCVAANQETGDIVSGASDKTVRIFTRARDRLADEETLKAFENSVKESAIPQQAMDQQINKEKLPGPEFLQQKSGTKEGQTQLIREANGTVSAHQWSTAANSWISIGTVVDSAGSSGRKTDYMGQDYDFVFDVDIEEGKPPLKLPYNLSQNPHQVAQKFIVDNNLPAEYINQVVDFIIKNTNSAATLGQQSGGPSAGQVPGSDPYGQEKRYRPEDQPTTAAPAAVPAGPPVLPQKDYLHITTAAFSSMSNRINTLNSQLLEAGRKDLSFSPDDLKLLTAALQQLEKQLSSAPPLPPANHPALDAIVPVAVKIATQWPEKDRVPGLDLLRCLAAATPAAVSRQDLLDALVEAGCFTPSPDSKAAMLGLRALANVFAYAEGRAYAADSFKRIHPLVKPFATDASGQGNKTVTVPAMTLYINYAVLLTSQPALLQGTPTRPSTAAFALAGDIVALIRKSKALDSESLYRSLVALGTLLRVAPDGADEEMQRTGLELASKTTAALRDVESRKEGKEPRMVKVVAEVRALVE